MRPLDVGALLVGLALAAPGPRVATTAARPAPPAPERFRARPAPPLARARPVLPIVARARASGPAPANEATVDRALACWSVMPAEMTDVVDITYECYADACVFELSGPDDQALLAFGRRFDVCDPIREGWSWGLEHGDAELDGGEYHMTWVIGHARGFGSVTIERSE